MPRSKSLERAIPDLKGARYDVTSPEDPSYNCIAWAAGDDGKWWEPVPGFGSGPILGGNYWPQGVPREYTLESYERAFRRQGYRRCASTDLKPEWEKVALYVDGTGIPSHAALQLPSGRWTSKMGFLEDIEHDGLDVVAGDGIYGTVALVMRRKRQAQQVHPRARNLSP